MSATSAWMEYLAATTECDATDYPYVELWAWERLQERLRRDRISHPREQPPQRGEGNDPSRPVGGSDASQIEGEGEDWTL